MREILFKAKRKDNGEWVEGLLIIMFGQHHIQKWRSENIAYSIDPKTICQYTGLTDKNGKRIWENDILKFKDEVWNSYYTSCGTEYGSWEVENYGVVGYCNKTARYDFCKYKYNENSVEADLHENHDVEFTDVVQESEVVGNIFDNTELLGEVEDERDYTDVKRSEEL